MERRALARQDARRVAYVRVARRAPRSGHASATPGGRPLSWRGGTGRPGHLSAGQALGRPLPARPRPADTWRHGAAAPFASQGAPCPDGQISGQVRSMNRTVRIADPDNPGTWVEVTVPWLCPVPSCRRPWSETWIESLNYHNADGVRTHRVWVHRWTRTCKHAVLNTELIELSRTMTT